MHPFTPYPTFIVHLSSSFDSTMGDGLISKRYIVLYQAVSPVLIDEVMANAATKERMWESLFLDSESFDHFRKQRAVEAHLAATLNKATQDYDKAYFPRATAVEWNLLHSLPGGQKQAPHRDYNFPMNFPHLDQDRMPGGLIVAMEANTVLHSYGWNHIVAEERNEHVVHLGKGDTFDSFAVISSTHVPSVKRATPVYMNT